MDEKTKALLTSLEAEEERRREEHRVTGTVKLIVAGDDGELARLKSTHGTGPAVEYIVTGVPRSPDYGKRTDAPDDNFPIPQGQPNVRACAAMVMSKDTPRRKTRTLARSRATDDADLCICRNRTADKKQSWLDRGRLVRDR
jgi:hypothetical protein